MAKKKKSKKSKEKPTVNPELEGFDIEIDRFGEIKSNFNIDRINEFLNQHVDDKKLRDREDLKTKDDDSDSEE
ncbi:MAG: hypothetical protein ACR2MX_09875 [Cyclobacteriaceae bacterium]